MRAVPKMTLRDGRSSSAGHGVLAAGAGAELVAISRIKGRGSICSGNWSEELGYALGRPPMHCQ